MSDERMRSIADSAQLKVLQYLVTALAVPGALWFSSRLLDDLDKIKTAQQRNEVQSAEVALKIAALERAGFDRQTALVLLKEQVIAHGYRIERLEERTGVRR